MSNDNNASRHWDLFSMQCTDPLISLVYMPPAVQVHVEYIADIIQFKKGYIKVTRKKMFTGR
jgi:hypothetical protein